MRAEVTKDTGRREITVRITGGPTLDVTESWQKRTQIIRCQQATLVIVDNEVRRITVRGGIIRKNGEPLEHTTSPVTGLRGAEPGGSRPREGRTIIKVGR